MSNNLYYWFRFKSNLWQFAPHRLCENHQRSRFWPQTLLMLVSTARLQAVSNSSDYEMNGCETFRFLSQRAPSGEKSYRRRIQPNLSDFRPKVNRRIVRDSVELMPVQQRQSTAASLHKPLKTVNLNVCGVCRPCKFKIWIDKTSVKSSGSKHQIACQVNQDSAKRDKFVYQWDNLEHLFLRNLHLSR